jgi:trimeric autotransporter adhesin
MLASRRSSTRMNSTATILIAVFVTVLGGSLCRGQVTSGTILGTVTDPTNAAVVGAKITITDTDTSVRSEITSDSKGNFELPYLPNGPYEVTITAPGFESFRQTGVILDIGQQYRVDATLRVGQSSQSITVAANTQVLQTDSSQLSETIDQRTIENVPNINRNPLLNVTLVAGVVTTGTFMDPNNVNTGDNARQNFSSLVVNGSAPLTSNIQLDGAMDTSPYANEILVMPNIEALAEANVVTNAYSAEYGRVAGGVINFTTKSGGNDFHGVLYEDFRNTDLNANSYGNNFVGRNAQGNLSQPRAPFNSNLFGGALGGPVWIPKVYDGHDKTFFFVSYEGLRRSTGQSTYYTVPTAIERTGDFSQTRSLVTVNGVTTAPSVNIYLPFPATTTTTQVAAGQYQLNRQQASYNGILNVIPPQYLDPTALKLVNYFPLPNITPLNADGTDNYFLNTPTIIKTDQIIIRLDRSFSPTRRGFFRWTTDWTLSNPPNLFNGTMPAANNNGPTTQFNPTATLGYDWTISPKDLLEIRANLSRLNLVLVPCCGGANYNFSSLGFAPSELVGLATKSFPEFVDGSYPQMGLGSFVYRENHTTVLSFTPNYTRLLNKWTTKLGMEYDAILYNFTQPYKASMDFSSTAALFSQACDGPGCATIPTTTVQGWGSANFLMGAIDGALGSGQYTTGDPSEALKNGYWAIYSQNDWKPNRDLTVNLGVRWEYQGPITDRYNRLSQFNLNGTNGTGTAGLYEFSGVGGDPRGQVNSAWKNWAPRIGFAYRLNDKTVVRSAYGISYIMTTGAGSGAQGFGSDGFSAPAYVKIRPASGLDILQNQWTNAYSSGGVTAGANPLSPILLGQNVTAVIRSDNATPYVQQWNFSIQRQLPSDTILQVAYVGTTGTHLQIQQTPVNQTDDLPASTLASALATYTSTGINPLTTLVANPFYGVVTNNTNLNNSTIQQQYLDLPYPAYGNVTRWFARSGRSNYNSLQVTVRRAFRNGFQLGGTYSYSKNIDFGQGYGAAVQTGSSEGTPYFAPGNRQLDRSVSDFDQPHRGVITYTWELPFGKGKRYLSDTPVATQVLGGWKLAGITTFASGFPLAITGTGFGRPNLIADPRLPAKDRIKGPGTVVLPTGQSYAVPYGYKLIFNPDAFQASVLTVPKAGSTGTINVANPYYYGTAPRMLSDLRGPGINNFDMSLSHDYPITEKLNLAIRLDAFNAFNRVQPGLAGVSFGSPNLTAPGVGYSTTATFGLLYLPTAQTVIGSSENTPRYLQISMRLAF